MRVIVLTFSIVFFFKEPELFSHAKKYFREIQNNQSIRIQLNEVEEKEPAEYSIALYEHYFATQFPDREEMLEEKKNGNYQVNLNKITQPIYINLIKKTKNDNRIFILLELYLAEPGDNITVNLAKKSIHFSGKGSAKYQCRYDIDKVLATTGEREVFDSKGVLIPGKYFDKSVRQAMDILNMYEVKMNRSAYSILAIDLFSSLETTRLEQAFVIDSTSLNRIVNNYQWKTARYEKRFAKNATVISAYYPQFIINKLSIGKYKRGNNKHLKEESIDDVYGQLKKNYSGELRDKVLTLFALNLSYSKFGQRILHDVLSTVHTKYCLQRLNSFAEQNVTGRAAYNFSLPDTSGKIVKLVDFKGKVVFMDFWFNGCLGCAQYYSKVISKAEEGFKKNDDVVFITISIDADRKKWMDGIYSGKYTSREIINLNTEGKGEDHPIIKNYLVSSYPRPLLVDREGKIFSNNYDELRYGGVDKLTETINKALVTR